MTGRQDSRPGDRRVGSGEPGDRDARGHGRALQRAASPAVPGPPPHANVSIHEADLGDPTAGLRAGLADVALIRTPFDSTGISTHALRAERVGVVMGDDDPLAHHRSVSAADLADRRWVRLPDGADPLWTAYWTGGAHDDAAPVMRTIQECLQAVVWNGTSALAPRRPTTADWTGRRPASRPPAERDCRGLAEDQPEPAGPQLRPGSSRNHLPDLNRTRLLRLATATHAKTHN